MEATVEKPRFASRAQSSTALTIASDCDTKATLPGKAKWEA
jgi:hypothetical protein